MKKELFEVRDANGDIRKEWITITDELEYEQNKDGVYVATKRSKIKNFFKKNSETFGKIGAVAGGIAGGVVLFVTRDYWRI